eukprot:1128989-Amphidinium_carterae.1
MDWNKTQHGDSQTAVNANLAMLRLHHTRPHFLCAPYGDRIMQAQLMTQNTPGHCIETKILDVSSFYSMVYPRENGSGIHTGFKDLSSEEQEENLLLIAVGGLVPLCSTEL